MCALYTNAGCRDLPEGSMEEDDDDDYENMTPPYKDLPPKPGWMAPPRPPRAGTDLMHLPSQSPVATTPVPWISQKFGGLMCYQERLLVYLCLLVVVSLLMGCTSLVVTLIKYQEVVEELRMLTFQHMAWRANVTGMVGLAGLKKDLERIRADTNQSLLELRGLLDCTRVTCPEGWLPFQGKCYYFSPSTKTWDEARTFCQENYSHLVIISNSDEQDFVAKAHGSPRVYWLGLNDINVEGDWRWLDGSPVTLSFWDPQEPNNLYNNENCASMNKGGTWNDLSCDKTTYWICERKCSC
ncbi:C-type lectin domain family 17, member A isoform 3-T3 [Dama dama]|uniref:C-type lectin domain family 17, member A isoform X3 n=1 Tax=Dama dama TaxID=30532 RepID=UPI002A35CA43|nr:C-type lectin domain family 17, member A isoform X3 [Dama dama]